MFTLLIKYVESQTMVLLALPAARVHIKNK